MIRHEHCLSRQCESQGIAEGEVQITLPRLVSQTKRRTTVRKKLQSIGATLCVGCGLLEGGASNVSLAQTGEAKHYPGSSPTIPINYQPASSSIKSTSVVSGDAPQRHRPALSAKLVSHALPIPRTQNERGSQTGASAHGIQTIPYLESPAGRTLEVVPVPVPARKTARPWLDIRPRSSDEENPSLIPLEELPADVSQLPPATGVPQLVQVYSVDLTQRDFCASTLFYHRPLYFEDCCLERCGATPGMFSCAPGVQSGLHFFARSAMLPLSMLHEPPHSYVRSGCTCR